MNVLHMKYAVEVARVGSINKASEVLLVAQPNLSRSIKELEADLGILIFDRSSKGMTLTPEGEEFISYAMKIIDQINSIEKMYKNGLPKKQKFSVSVTGASYISDAFARFTNSIGTDPAEISCMETDSGNVLNNILSSDYNLGIIRYSQQFDEYFKAMPEEKGLVSKLIAEFCPVLIMHRDSDLASLREIHFSDLSSHIEIAHNHLLVPTLPAAQVRKEEPSYDTGRRIFVYDRAGQFELLSENKDTFMWMSPLPDKVLDRYGLVQRECPDNRTMYKDVLIYRKDHTLTDLDNRFIDEVFRAKEII